MEKSTEKVTTTLSKRELTNVITIGIVQSVFVLLGLYGVIVFVLGVVLSLLFPESCIHIGNFVNCPHGSSGSSSF